MVRFGGMAGFNYDPQCIRVSAGARVTFGGDFRFHPLAPGQVAKLMERLEAGRN